MVSQDYPGRLPDDFSGFMRRMGPRGLNRTEFQHLFDEICRAARAVHLLDGFSAMPGPPRGIW